MLHLSNEQQNKGNIGNENKNILGHIKATSNLDIQIWLFLLEH